MERAAIAAEPDAKSQWRRAKIRGSRTEMGADICDGAGGAGPGETRETKGRGGNGALRDFFSDLPDTLRAPDAETPRGRILEHARALFASRGFAPTTIRAIAGEARVNPAMIHYYYGSKSLLYRRVIAIELIATLRGVFDRIEPGLPASEHLIRIPLGIMREMHTTPERVDLLRRELAEGAGEAKAAILEMSRHGPLGLWGLLAPIVRQGQAEKSVRDVPIETLLPFLLSVGHGSMILEPLFRLVLGIESGDETAWERRLLGFEDLLRRGVLVEE
jgi:AcrR family transcriptional regulator